MTLGEFLREKREAKGVGLRKMARLIKRVPSCLSHAERGRSEPGLEILEGYVKHLRLSQEESDLMYALAGRLPPGVDSMMLYEKGVYRSLRTDQTFSAVSGGVG